MDLSDEFSTLLPYLIGDIYNSISVDESEHSSLNDDFASTPKEIHVSRSSKSIKKAKPRREGTSLLPSSTVSHRRKKAELHALRLEAQYLMEKLTRLQQTHDGNSKPKDMTVEGDDWFSRATNAYDERIRSERSNQLLKMILMKRIKVFESVRKRLRQRDVLEPTTDRPFFQPNCTGFILSHLESKLWSLRLQANVVVPTVSPNRHVTFHTQPGYMVGGEKAAAKTFSMAREQGSQYRDETNDTSCIASLFMQDTSQMPLYVDAASTFRKYEEKDRAVVVGTTVWLIPTEGLEIEGAYWFLVEIPMNILVE
ncbi:uncharacterized protein PITG_21473 [Phytophthora infestans T30-4]|uniref:M96 mating-specific protein family n=1 Tax=Phytophthora infestans (strain T30-4) TaxID=403677 RepID=D0P3R7_PHYIT|nr:uncharacterized protein PITG_21473 [Phytophthora infestans T30-4]EEY60724.1 hypothetical protein PITG_21473 [Phytophthora infestans T30-4]|eukprot:XP_002895057.1 hypothetical protein PITG_21473 [Phytophthora infestans T30-4]